MSKEHSGGLEHGLFRVPGEWSDDHRFAVKIEFFDFEAVDSFDDAVREEIEQHGTASHFFKRLVRLEVERARGEAVVAVLSEIVQAKNPHLAATLISIASGMMLTAEKSGADHARAHGVSKQDIQQGAEEYRRKLGLRKTRTLRDEEARKLMRASNYRRSNK